MRTKKTIINTVVGLGTLFISTILGFVLTRTFIGALGIEYNGLNGLFNNVLAILSIGELGIAGAISLLLYKPIYEKNNDQISELLSYFKKSYKVIGSAILIISLVISMFIPIFVKDATISENYIRFVFILFALNTSISYFFSYNRTLIYAKQENYFLLLIDFAYKTLKVFLQVFLLIKYENYLLFLLVNIIFTFLNNLTIHILARKKYPEIIANKTKTNQELKKEIHITIKSLALIQVLSVSINFTDNIIVASIINISAAGLFVNYNLIYSQLSMFINTIFNGLGASLGNLLAEDNKNRIKEVLYNLEYFSFFIGSFCFINLLFLTQIFIGDIWLKREYLLSNFFLVLFAINFYVLVIKQVPIYYLRLSGKQKQLIKPLFIESFLNLFISILLAYYIGIEGVIIGTIVSSIVGFILISSKYYLQTKQKIMKSLLRHITFLIVLVLETAVLAFIFTNISFANDILNFVFIGAISSIITVSVSLFILLKKENLELLRRIFRWKKS